MLASCCADQGARIGDATQWLKQNQSCLHEGEMANFTQTKIQLQLRRVLLNKGLPLLSPHYFEELFTPALNESMLEGKKELFVSCLKQKKKINLLTAEGASGSSTSTFPTPLVKLKLSKRTFYEYFSQSFHLCKLI